MKTLKERQADRAGRKIENQALSDAPNTGNDRIGELASQAAAISSEIDSLSPADRTELNARLANGGTPTEGFKATDDYPLAGIGIANPFVVPVVGVAGGALSGNGSNADPASLSPADALTAANAAASWGTGAPADQSGPIAEAAPATTADETVDADGKALTKTQLGQILNDRNVAFETDANLTTLQGLVKANPAKA